MSEGLTHNVSTHAHVRSSRENPKRDIDGPSPRASLRCDGPNPNFQTSYLPLSHSSILSSSSTWLSSCVRLYMSPSHRADNTSLAHLPLPFDLLFLSYRLKSPLSYYIVLYVQISRKLRDRASIAFFSVSLARPALPLLPVTFSPSKDSRRGSSRRITAYKFPTMS